MTKPTDSTPKPQVIEQVVHNNAVVIAPKKVIKRDCPDYQSPTKQKDDDATLQWLQVGGCHKTNDAIKGEYLDMLSGLRRKQGKAVGFDYWEKQPEVEQPITEIKSK